MFTKIQYRILSLFAGGTFLTSLLASTLAGGMINQGTPGSTGPQGPSGEVGPQGPSGEDGREVEFQVSNNVLQWRYVDEQNWNNLNLDFGSGGSSPSVINTGASSAFTHWIFAEEKLAIPFPTITSSRVTTGFTEINNLAQFLSIKDNLTGKYVLKANIDFSSLTESDLISTNYKIIPGVFKGTLDGAGYKLLNLNIGEDTNFANSVENVGVFESLEGATIRNISLENFTYKLQGFSSRIGALAGTITDANKPTLIDNVDVIDFSIIIENGAISYVGGFAGSTSYDSTTQIYQSNVNKMMVKLASTVPFQSYVIGGFFGYGDGNIIIGESSAILEFDNTQRSHLIGGAIGEVDYQAIIQVNDSDFYLSGAFEYEAGGFAGRLQGDVKLSITNSTFEVDIEPIYFQDFWDGYYIGYDFGGVLGELNDDSLVFIDNVETLGTIKGVGNLGGFIGALTDDDILLRIENSVNRIDLYGQYEVGGFIGETGDYPRIKVLIDSSANFGNLSSFNEAVFGELYNAGGFIGYVDEHDGNNILTNWNQIWIRNSEANFEFHVEQAIEQALALNQDFEFEYLGGAIGQVYDDNFIRLTNNVISSSINFLIDDSSYVFGGIDLYGVGGLIGTVDDDTDILLLNNIVTIDLNFTFTNNVSAYTSENSLDFEFDRIGGAIGEFDGKTIIDVAGSYELNFNLEVSGNDFENLNFELVINEVGGYIGYLDSESTIINDAVSSTLNLHVLFSLLANTNFVTIDVEINLIGAVVGNMRGFGFFGNFVSIVEVDVVIPEEDETITIAVIDFETISFNGNNNTFYIVSND